MKLVRKNNIMKTVVFSAIKGGVGKSSLAIMVANFLNATGKKVLFIDADPQNSATFYYVPDKEDIDINLSNILIGKSATENIIDTHRGVELIPSSLHLINRRNDDINILSTSLESIKHSYDYCIIDTAPTFDNVVINTLITADIIVTPVVTGNFDFKSTLFYRDLLNEANLLHKWKVVFNKSKTLITGGSINAQYFHAYQQTFHNNLFKSKIPENSAIKRYFDVGEKITSAKAKIAVAEAVKNFTNELFNSKYSSKVF